MAKPVPTINRVVRVKRLRQYDFVSFIAEKRNNAAKIKIMKLSINMGFTRGNYISALQAFSLSVGEYEAYAQK